MSTVVADLVARISAQGVQEAASQVRAVGAEAAQTARALEIMAAQFAKLHGGTAADALSMFQRTGAQPTAAAMAEAAKATERMAAAAASAVAPTQSAARASEDVQKGWNASESSAVRFGASLVGVGLGISLIAGTARLLHEAISSVVDSQIAWEQSLVTVRGLYGSIGSAIIATSQAQAAAPGLLGSQQEFAQANLNASYLSRRYGLSASTVTGLTSSAGAASFALGQDEATRRDLQARALAFAEGGGSSLRAYGVEGDPLSISRGLGGVSPAQLAAVTPSQLKQAQTLIATQGLDQFAIRGDQDQPGLLSRRAQLEKAQTEAQSALQTGLEGSGTTNQLASMQLSRRGLPANPQAVAAAVNVAELQKAVDDANAALKSNAAELGNHVKSLADATVALSKLGVEAGTAAFKLLGFGGSIEDRYSIARGDVGAQAQGAVTARARSAFPARAMSDTEIGALARGSAAQSVWQNYVAEQAQAEQANAVREQLQAIVQTGPGNQRAAAGRALDELPRREQAGVVTGMANRAGDLASRAGTEADAQLQAISLRSEERRLFVAEQLAGYRMQSLQAEAALAPILLQQANLQDRMVVAARDNLTSRRALIQAEQQALAATNVTSAYDYQAQRLELLAEQSRANVRAGGAPTQDISSLRQQYRGLELQRATSGADLAALDAQRGVQVVGQQRTGEQLTRDATLTNLEAQARALQDQQIPLDQNLRRYQAEEASIQRSLDLLNLTDVKQITAAARQQVAANQLRLVTDEIARQADDYANGLNLGATAAERSQAALEKARDALKETVPLLNSLASTAGSDVSARLANGLGAGGLGPSRGGPAGFSVVIEAGQTQEQFKTQVHISVEEALNKFFAGMSTGGPPAPSTVGGAGR